MRAGEGLKFTISDGVCDKEAAEKIPRAEAEESDDAEFSYCTLPVPLSSEDYRTSACVTLSSGLKVDGAAMYYDGRCTEADYSGCDGRSVDGCRICFVDKELWKATYPTERVPDWPMCPCCVASLLGVECATASGGGSGIDQAIIIGVSVGIAAILLIAICLSCAFGSTILGMVSAKSPDWLITVFCAPAASTPKDHVLSLPCCTRAPAPPSELLCRLLEYRYLPCPFFFRLLWSYPDTQSNANIRNIPSLSGRGTRSLFLAMFQLSLVQPRMPSGENVGESGVESSWTWAFAANEIALFNTSVAWQPDAVTEIDQCSREVRGLDDLPPGTWSGGYGASISTSSRTCAKRRRRPISTALHPAPSVPAPWIMTTTMILRVVWHSSAA